MALKRVISVLIFFLLYIHVEASNSQVLYIDDTNEKNPEAIQVEIASDFYGVKLVHAELKEVIISEEYVSHEISSYRGVIISSSVLNSTVGRDLLRLFSTSNNKLRVLVLGVNPEDDLNIIHEYSQVPLTCKKNTFESKNLYYTINGYNDVAFELSGLTLRYAGLSRKHVFVMDEGDDFDQLIEVSDNSVEGQYPIFIRTNIKEMELFLSTGLDLSSSDDQSQWVYNRENFMELAPVMMFIRYIFGNRAWHPSNHFANLTIDDPFLIEPYGNLYYQKLLNEMEQEDFHTTIAFIPYYYDRYDVEVVRLFNDNTDRYSLSIHGNNHDHREFDFYIKRPLADQEQDVRQALARMEVFHKKTNIPYDKVMVFPHGIAPKETLSILNRYGFIATFNGTNVPLDEPAYNSAQSQLRSVTISYSNFPSYSRHGLSRSYSYDSNVDVEHIKSMIATDFFLGNPIVFYTHQDFFYNSIESFNIIAKLVNSFDQEVRWTSLGEIARHNYLLRAMNKQTYEVLALSNTLNFENKTNKPITYNVMKKVASEITIKRVITMNGDQLEFIIHEGLLRFVLKLNPGDVQYIKIEQDYDVYPLEIDLSERVFSVIMIRLAADIRDLILSRNGIGRWISRLYYMRRNIAYLYIFMLVVLTSLGITVLCYAKLNRFSRHRVKKTIEEKGNSKKQGNCTNV